MKVAASAVAIASFASSAMASHYFSLIAARSGSPIHLQSLDAQKEGIYIGKKTETYCPSKEVNPCPPGKFTNFALAEDGGELAMGAEVPGGQQVYIDGTSGAIGYTIAHSASTPEGAKLEGWIFNQETGQGAITGTLGWRERGLLACPVEGGSSTEGPWQIFVDIKTATFSSDCLGFDAIATNQTKPQAWQYE